MKQKWSLWLVLFRSSKPEFFFFQARQFVSWYQVDKNSQWSDLQFVWFVSSCQFAWLRDFFCWNSVILTDFLILINISITKVRLTFFFLAVIYERVVKNGGDTTMQFLFVKEFIYLPNLGSTEFLMWILHWFHSLKYTFRCISFVLY